LTYERDFLVELARLEASLSRPRVVAASHRLLVQVLEERIEYTRERIFRLLGLTYRQDEIASLWNRIVSGRPSVKAAALEYLANLLSRTHAAPSSRSSSRRPGSGLAGPTSRPFLRGGLRLLRRPGTTGSPPAP
jgi:hypothetical protein